MKPYLLTAWIVILELACALEVTIFALLYIPLDPGYAESVLNEGTFAQGGLVLFFSVIALAVSAVLKQFDMHIFSTDFPVRKILIFQMVFIILAALKYLSILLGLKYHILLLLSAAAAFLVLLQAGLMLYHSEVPVWKHPTTTGFLIVSGFILAVSVVLLSGSFNQDTGAMLKWLAGLLILEIPVLFSRFRFLTHAGGPGRDVAAKLLGDQILIFGGFIIAGIFIPLVFIFFSFWTQADSHTGISILVILGVLLERSLFFSVTGTGRP
jgi:hypothetical protein